MSPWIMSRQLDGRARVEELGVEIARGCPCLECGEQQGGECDADGSVATQKRDGDADEADRRALDLSRYRDGTPSRAMSSAPARPANTPAMAIARK